MGIQINGQTDTISASDGGFTIDGASGNLIGNLTGTASTATAAATAYGLSGSPTLSGITSVSTTNLTVNGNNFPSAGPLSNRNLIINGSINVKQRGDASKTTDGYLIDQFVTGSNGGTQTTTRETLSSGLPYDEGFRYFLRLANTSVVTDTAANYRFLLHSIEAQNICGSGWNYINPNSYITISFWVRASVSQEYYVYITTDDGTTQRYSFSTGNLSSNTWTKVVHTIPGNSNITINNDNGSGITIVVSPFWGTDFTDSGVSVGSWATYSSGTRTPDFTTTWATTAGATFDITGVQLEVGEVATPFEHRSYGDELARCQRYFQKSSSGTTSYPSSSGYARAYVAFPVYMRAAPTLTLTDLGSGGSILASGSDVDGLFVTYQSLGASAAGTFSWTASSEL